MKANTAPEITVEEIKSENSLARRILLTAEPSNSMEFGKAKNNEDLDELNTSNDLMKTAAFSNEVEMRSQLEVKQKKEERVDEEEKRPRRS